MAIKAYQGIAPEWYTPRDEEGQDEPAQFYLQPLTGPQLLEVQAFFDAENTTVTGPGLVLACKFGIRNWNENITGEDDKARRFSRAGIQFLPAEIIAELGAKIVNLSVQDVDEACHGQTIALQMHLGGDDDGDDSEVYDESLSPLHQIVHYGEPTHFDFEDPIPSEDLDGLTITVFNEVDFTK